MSLIRQEIKDGVIVDRKENYLWVVLDQPCRTKGKCHTGCGGCGGEKPVLKKKIYIDKTSTFNQGQKITLKMNIPNENIAALLVFGIPVLMALSCTMLWYLNNPQKAESPLALLTTALSFVTGFLVVWIIDTNFRRAYPPAVILPSLNTCVKPQEQERSV
ncbi:MAG TPA: SoxR reducing system RseC family protein [Chitinispirillaceae bacterium]|nr:SoxR reducing system RseC family protein [Chitinispirillaceae bacterium]